jgi:hypothetical protein
VICRTIQKRTRHDDEAAKLHANAREPIGTREIAVQPEVSVDFVLNGGDDCGIGRRGKKLSPQPAPRRPCSPKQRESCTRRQRIDRRAAIRRLGPFNKGRARNSASIHGAATGPAHPFSHMTIYRN